VMEEAIMEEAVSLGEEVVVEEEVVVSD